MTRYVKKSFISCFIKESATEQSLLLLETALSSCDSALGFPSINLYLSVSFAASPSSAHISDVGPVQGSILDPIFHG